MDKLMMGICKQQPYIDIECTHCKKQNKFKTLDFFKNSTYEFKCPKCNSDLTYNTSQFEIDLKKVFKSLNFKF